MCERSKRSTIKDMILVHVVFTRDRIPPPLFPFSCISLIFANFVWGTGECTTEGNTWPNYSFFVFLWTFSWISCDDLYYPKNPASFEQMEPVIPRAVLNSPQSRLNPIQRKPHGISTAHFPQTFAPYIFSFSWQSEKQTRRSNPSSLSAPVGQFSTHLMHMPDNLYRHRSFVSGISGWTERSVTTEPNRPQEPARVIKRLFSPNRPRPAISAICRCDQQLIRVWWSRCTAFSEYAAHICHLICVQLRDAYKRIAVGEHLIHIGHISRIQ